MKQMLKSLGNPGLMGMGKRKADKKLFLKNREKILGILE
jgi:hypothetical protein